MFAAGADVVVVGGGAAAGSLVGDGERVSCGVCLDDFSAASDAAYTLPCGHTHHRACAAAFARARLMRGDAPRCWAGESGPDLACGALVPDDDLARLLGAEAWSAAARLRDQRADLSLRFCPRAACGAPVRGGSAAAPALRCAACGGAFCFTHATAHAGSDDCAAYAARADVAAEARASDEAIAASAKRCPRCAAWVERAAGCNVVACPCACAFCWLCGDELPPGDELPAHYQARRNGGRRMRNPALRGEN